MQCFRNFPVAKKFVDKRGGLSRSSVEKFFSHGAENFRRGILYYFTSFRYRKMLGIKEREGGEYQDFPPKNVSPTVPKNFAGESFTVSLISGIE